MSHTPQAVTPAPAAPAPTVTQDVQAPAPVVLTQSGNDVVGRVLSGSEIDALRDARSELSSQLISATNRRDDFVEQLKDATGVNRAGLEERIKLLDTRILGIEAEIARTGQQLTNSIAQNPFPDTPLNGMRADPTAISIVITIFVLAPIAFAVARMIWRWASATKAPPSSFEKENAERMLRLEQAVESIAIEVERVSEGQRFVTKLLSESHDRAKLGVPRN